MNEPKDIPMRDSETASSNSPLPPSVEKAYHQKCISLKKRINEIAASNDTARIQKHRVEHALIKMRMERAMLLGRLAKVQKQELKDVLAGDESDRSTSPPPTPHARLPRTRRHQSPPQDSAGYPIINGSPPALPPPRTGTPPHLLPGRSHSSTMAPSNGVPATSSVPLSNYPPHPTASTPTRFKEPPSSTHVDRRAPSEIHPSENLPYIHNLPNGTNVVIIDGRPKQPPWTIRDVEPRHHLIPGFDEMPLDVQIASIQSNAYCPYDVHGHPVVINDLRDEEGRVIRLKQLFKNDTEWKDPVVDNVRTDDPREVARQAQLRERGKARLAGAEEAALPPSSGRRSVGSRERRRESGRDSGSAPGSSHGRKDGGSGGSGGGFTAVNR